MQNEKCEQPTGHIDLLRHKRIVCIGDMHGDLSPFLEVMVKARLISVPQDVMDAGMVCHTSKDEQERTGYPITRKQAHSISWIGKTAVAVFTGDILDNRRSANQDKFGVCGRTGTQEMIMYLLWRLNQLARRNGGRVIWVLGNHDVANYVKDERNSMCRSYAPQLSYDEEKDENYHTCGPLGEFSDARLEKIKRKVIGIRAVAILRIIYRGDSVLVMHGGLCQIGTLAAETFPLPYRINKAYTPQQNVHILNSIFWDAAHGSELATKVINYYSEILPTWCRPTRIDNADDMRDYFGTAKLVKAHDVQKEMNCNVGGEKTASGKQTMEDGELCRIDISMSRAFEKYRSGYFGYCEVTVEEGKIHREIHQWPAPGAFIN